MKKAIVILLALSYHLSAQQLPQYSQYMLNEMAINPAVAGRDNYSEVRSNNRHQWVGITDAPRTYMMTLQGPLKNQKMGLGMNLYTDIVGPTRRTGVSFSYAYHLKLTEKYKLSLGLSAGLMQWGIDGNKITLRDEGDQQLMATYKTAPVPDIGAGLYFYQKNRFYVGIAMPQMYRAPISLYDGAIKNSRLSTQMNLNGAYTFDIDDNFSIEPSLLLKYVKPAPLKIDVGFRAIYQKQVWLGAVYRHNDAASFLIGYMYKDYLTIGYSYDVTTTRIKKISGGTHELMLGLRFSRKQAATWESKTN
jgi:type IX secretion system PorP/SprF family membrane protein